MEFCRQLASIKFYSRISIRTTELRNLGLLSYLNSVEGTLEIVLFFTSRLRKAIRAVNIQYRSRPEDNLEGGMSRNVWCFMIFGQPER